MTKKAPRTNDEQPLRAKRTVSRRRRRVHHATLATLIGIALGLLLVTRSGLLKFILLPQIESRLSCKADCRRVVLDSSGELVIRDLILTAPGIDGAASRFLYAPEARVELAMDSWWPGSLHVGRIKLYEPTVRISQAEDLSLNISNLFAATSASPTTRIPEVVVREGSLELGEHGNGSFVPVLSLGVRGGIAADQAHAGVYKIDLIGDPRRMVGATGLVDAQARTHLEGALDLNDGSFELHADDINLTALSARSATRSFRGYWEQLGLKGRIPSASLTYTQQDGLAAKLDLASVDLAIPVPVTAEEEVAGEESPVTENESLDMEEVTGDIRFDRRGFRAALAGRVEDLPLRVTLQTQGLSMDAPLTCRIETDEFSIYKGQQPRLLAFVPGFAQRMFRRFSSPGATLKGSVVLRRVLDETGAEDWRYDGAFDLHDGEAQYEQFPYPFEKIEATFIFDQDKFEMPRISGIGRATGAKLLASGIITPPSLDAEVNVDVTLVDLPMDDVFKESLPEHARAVYDVLFSDEAYNAGVAANRILDPATIDAKQEAKRQLERQIAALETTPSPETPKAPPDAPAESDPLTAARAQLAALDASLAAPPFALGGKARLHLLLHRPRGLHQPFSSDIDFQIPKAGIMPSAFPYPTVAQDVSIKMADGLATVAPSVVTGLSGATGTLDGRVEYSLEPGGEYHPRINIHAQNVPLDAYLIGAIPERGPMVESSLPSSPRELLESLNISGAVACDATIASRDAGHVGFDVDVGFHHVKAAPAPDLAFDDVSGSLHVSETALRIDKVEGLLGGQPFSLSLAARFANDAGGAAGPAPVPGPRLSGVLSATQLDLDQPIESILSLAAPEQAHALSSLRAAHHPSGRLDAQLAFEQTDTRLDYTLKAEDLHDVAFDAFGARFRLGDASGSVTISNDAAQFDQFRAVVAAADAPEPGSPTSVRLDGTFARRPGVAGVLDIGVDEGRFESPVLRAIAGAMSSQADHVLRDWKPSGRFDLQAKHTTFEGARAPVLSWAIEPHSFSFEHLGKTIAFPTITGRIEHSGTSGRVSDLRLDADGWSVTADGTFAQSPALEADLRFGLDAARITPQLIASLPSPVSQVAGAIDVQVKDHLTLRDARLRYRQAAADGEPRLAFDGAIDFAGLSAKPGVSLTDAGGNARIHYVQTAGAEKPDFSVEMNADFFRVFGVEMTNANARLEQGDRPDVHLLRRFEAESNGGRISGYAAFADAKRMGLDAPGRSYEIHTEVAGVAFGPMLEQMKPGHSDAADPVDRGRVDASFSIFGAFADESTRRGRGTIRVEGGDVLNMPGIVPLLELSNLQPPANEKIDLAYTDFFIDADTLRFEDLYLYSPSIRITGSGVMGWPSTDLDLRIETRGMRQIPILSEILTSVREEIVSTRVTGTLYHPRFRYEQLSGARRLFGAVLGGDGEERDQR